MYLVELPPDGAMWDAVRRLDWLYLCLPHAAKTDREPKGR